MPQPKPFAEPPALLRLDGIDLLRGFSILAVVLLHSNLRLFFSGHPIWPLVPRWLFPSLFLQGDNGVTVFFAISGFLITLTSLHRFGSLARMRARSFYRIRFARIAPLLLLVLVVLSVLHLAHAGGFRIPASQTALSRALLAALTFHLNWLEAAHGYLPANWDVLWSLSVEEMFYLFFPLVCLALLRTRRGMPAFVVLLLLFVAMGPFARSLWTTNEIWQEKCYLGGMDAIALGCLTALLTDLLWPDRLLRAGWVQRNPRLLLAIQTLGALLMLLIVAWPRWHWMDAIGRSGTDGTVLALGTCLVLFAVTLRGRAGRAWSAPVRWFGRHSYEVYLTHEFVVVWMTALYLKLLRGPLLLWIAAMVLLSAVLGGLVARYFSEPMNRRLRGTAPLPRHRLPEAQEQQTPVDLIAL
jgi:peptidoglycan/LPS O-acetylase OafA/YrhL